MAGIVQVRQEVAQVRAIGQAPGLVHQAGLAFIGVVLLRIIRCVQVEQRNGSVLVVFPAGGLTGRGRKRRDRLLDRLLGDRLAGQVLLEFRFRVLVVF